MQLTSPAFRNNSTLPVDYTCKGKGVNPPLTISGAPDGTKSLVLIMHDPDAVGGQDFLHWSVWNIAPDATDLAEGAVPPGAVQALNDYPQLGYGPACPPHGTGTHRYTFDLYALDATLDLPEGSKRREVEAAMQGHTLATAQLIGLAES